MKVEMIESYIRRDDDYDYHYNDNHGILTRCKDCKHYVRNDGGYCPKMIGAVSEDDYCSKAERREDDN